ncbi:hypothetical protein [Cereibacter changlensis]|uniref:hypothetical protein n=1 Tax=Cereibacter changlensis TaxID=402884 RepID=UPI00145D0D8A|nr:hypothetical protein [Cereibacter changlensis]
MVARQRWLGAAVAGGMGETEVRPLETLWKLTIQQKLWLSAACGVPGSALA